MANANIFEIMNRPAITREVYDNFNEEFDALMSLTKDKIQDAWTEFNENGDLPQYERMSAIETCFLTSLLDWQELTSRAQEEIGRGYPMEFQDVYVQFGIVDVEHITVYQLEEIEESMFELIGIMRAVMIHAATRIIEPEPVM